MKKVIKVFSFLLILMICTSFCINVFALGDGLDEGILNDVTKTDNTINNKFDSTFNNIFGQIMTILEVLAVAGIAINGVRYMYAEAGDKAKIKQSLIYIIIGTIMVFGTHLIVELISNAWNNSI